jgi:beta-xylosidase
VRAGRAVALLTIAVAATLAPVARAAPPAAYRNPVFDRDFPDPFVLPAAGAYWAYATNNGWNVQTLRSVDGVTWAPVTTDALPRLPAWARPGETWAPEVTAAGGRYVMWYTTARRSDGRHCLSRAIAPLPQGPFTDSSTSPAFCHDGEGGAIDPSPFADRLGRRWLAWKSEGRGPKALPATIWTARLTDDAAALASWPFRLVSAGLPWEGGVVEAPTVVDTGAATVLLYSGNRWDTAGYAVGAAACAGPAGPCTKQDAPVLRSSRSVAGPGGQTIFRDATGAFWLGYHAWHASAIGYPRGARTLRLDQLAFRDGRPVVHGPTDTLAVRVR